MSPALVGAPAHRWADPKAGEEVGVDQATAAAGPRPRPWWRTPRAGVAAMVVVLLSVSALAWAVDLTGAAGPPLTPALPWWALAPLFALAEVVVLHVQVRREAQAVSLSEIPLVLAVYLAAPADMLLATVVGTGLVYAVYRRQSPVKAVFNTTLRVFGVSAALVVFHAVVGPGAAAAHHPVGWLAAMAGVSVAGAADGLLVLAVVGLHEGRVERTEVVTALARYPVISAVVACAGVLIVTSLHADPRTTPLLVVLGAAILIAYRAHASLNDRHVSLAQLYDFGRAVTGSHAADEILASALLGARALLKAEAAEVVLLGDEPGQRPRRWTLAPGSAVVRSDEVGDGTHPALWHSVLLSGHPVLTTQSSSAQEATAHAEQLAALGYREAVVVALRDESRVLGSLDGRRADGGGARVPGRRHRHPGDVANQAGLALAKGRLLDRMRHEALHDVLTGLPNRTKFRDAVQQSLARSPRVPSAGSRCCSSTSTASRRSTTPWGTTTGTTCSSTSRRRLVAASPAAAPCPASAATSSPSCSRTGGRRGRRPARRGAGARGPRDAGRSSTASRCRCALRSGSRWRPRTVPTCRSLLRAADSAMYRAKVRQGGTQVLRRGRTRPPAADPAAQTRSRSWPTCARRSPEGHRRPRAAAGRRHRTGIVRASRRWSAGATPGSGCCRRPSSSRSPSGTA